MQYRLRTLLITLALTPMAFAWAWQESHAPPTPMSNNLNDLNVDLSKPGWFIGWQPPEPPAGIARSDFLCQLAVVGLAVAWRQRLQH